MRYFAFVLVLLDVGMQAMAKEYPYPVRKERVHLREVFTLSLKHKKFMACLLLMFVWNYISNLNSGLWNYYLLNTVGFPYSTVTFASATYPIFLLLFTPMWRRVLGRYSWIRTFGLCTAVWVPTEIMMFFVSSASKGIFLPGGHAAACRFRRSEPELCQRILHEPAAGKRHHAHLLPIGILQCIRIPGADDGHAVVPRALAAACSISGAVPITAVQFTTLFRAVTMLPLGMLLMHFWRSFTPDSEVEAMDLAAGKR